MCAPVRGWLLLNSAEFLDDLFVKQNAFNTKQAQDTKMFAIMGQNNIVFMDTFHQDYNATRKVLSAAFFKNKLKVLTRVIKKEVVEYVAEIQSQNQSELDIV